MTGRPSWPLAGINEPLLLLENRIPRRGHWFMLLLEGDEAASHGEQFALQGYWKTSRGLPVLGGADLQNAGFDLWLTQPAGRVVIWGNYSMAWAWTELVEGERTDIFSGRHYLRAGAMADLGRGVRLEGDIAYGAGLEFGEIPRPGPSNLSVVPGEATDGDAVRPSFLRATPPRQVRLSRPCRVPDRSRFRPYS